MRGRTLWLLGLMLAPAALGVACSLNPQPLPPDNPDAGGLAIDGGTKDATPTGFDSGGGDASFDAAPPPPGDGGEDASEDASDAETDAADASDADADDGATDATSE